MEYCNLTKDLKVSRIITGMWQIADMERNGRILDKDLACTAMDAYFQAGFTSFDMADHYGSAELIAGKFKEYRSLDRACQFLTKWVPEPGKTAASQAEQAVASALEKTKSESLDLLQFHAWNYADPSYIDTLKWLCDLKEKGWIRHLGVTNFDAPHVKMLLDSGFEIVSNQISFSLLDRRASKKMLPLCEAYGIHVLAFGVLAGGFLTDRWLDKDEPSYENLETWSQMKYLRFIKQAGGWQVFQGLLKVIGEIAEKHDVSMANVATRCILDQSGVGAVIIGARLNRSQHIADNLAVFSLHLDEEDRSRIAECQASMQDIPGNCGDEYRKPPFLTASGDLSHHLEAMPPPYEPQYGERGRAKVFSGTVWEDLAGYCRAQRAENKIYISGTTATHRNRLIGGDDAASQTVFIFDKMEGALASLGSSLEDLVRTRVYVKNTEDWEPVSRVHGERLASVQPANTLVGAELIGSGYLVEIEAEAVVGSGKY